MYLPKYVHSFFRTHNKAAARRVKEVGERRLYLLCTLLLLNQEAKHGASLPANTFKFYQTWSSATQRCSRNVFSLSSTEDLLPCCEFISSQVHTFGFCIATRVGHHHSIATSYHNCSECSEHPTYI